MSEGSLSSKREEATSEMALEVKPPTSDRRARPGVVREEQLGPGLAA
jgi:hypothetical protein